MILLNQVSEKLKKSGKFADFSNFPDYVTASVPTADQPSGWVVVHYSIVSGRIATQVSFSVVFGVPPEQETSCGRHSDRAAFPSSRMNDRHQTTASTPWERFCHPVCHLPSDVAVFFRADIADRFQHLHHSLLQSLQVNTWLHWPLHRELCLQTSSSRGRHYRTRSLSLRVIWMFG